VGVTPGEGGWAAWRLTRRAEQSQIATGALGMRNTEWGLKDGRQP
jgi:hypothetical protein